MPSQDEWITSIGKNLKAKRKKRGLTQEQLAEKMGTDRTTISRHESGKTVLDSLNLLWYSQALGCSPKDFIPTTSDLHPMLISEMSRARELPPEIQARLAAQLHQAIDMVSYLRPGA